MYSLSELHSHFRHTIRTQNFCIFPIRKSHRNLIAFTNKPQNKLPYLAKGSCISAVSFPYIKVPEYIYYIIVPKFTRYDIITDSNYLDAEHIDTYIYEQ